MVGFFVKKHMAVFSFSILVIIIGIMSYLDLPRESVPEIKQPYIFVTTTYPGIAAKDIENLVTRPIEEEIDGVEGLSEITSSSQQSLSFIVVEFTSDVTVEEALVKVRERVDLAKAFLPDDVDEPVIQELNSSNWPVFTVSLSNPGYPGFDSLKVMHQSANQLRDELERIPGVLDVDISGNLDREIAINIDPIRLEHYGLTMNDVIMAVQSENISIPGGILESQTKNYSLSVTGEIKNPDEFKDIIVRSEGKQVKLEDLTSNTDYFIWSEQETYSRINGYPCISISLKKRTGENLIALVDKAKEVIEELKSTFPEGTIVTTSYDESIYKKHGCRS
jgi:multidrug efflux pump subunit AcrB